MSQSLLRQRLLPGQSIVDQSVAVAKSLNRFFVSDYFRALSVASCSLTRSAVFNRFFVSDYFRANYRLSPLSSGAFCVSIASSSAITSGQLVDAYTRFTSKGLNRFFVSDYFRAMGPRMADTL